MGSKRDSSDGGVSVAAKVATNCDRCGRSLEREAYVADSPNGHQHRCMRCMAMHPTLVRRCMLISLIVGTLLTLINHAGTLIDGNVSASLAWKVPLNYAVPYTVATVSALLNARAVR